MISTLLARPTLRVAGSTLIQSTRSFSSTPAPQATLRELEMRIRSVGNIGKYLAFLGTWFCKMRS